MPNLYSIRKENDKNELRRKKLLQEVDEQESCLAFHDQQRPSSCVKLGVFKFDTQNFINCGLKQHNSTMKT